MYFIVLNYIAYSMSQKQEVTPESEFSADGFRNTAAEVFVQGLAGIVDQNDVETMIRAQKHMLQRFEKTNEMLLNCNSLSSCRLKTANDDFKRHVKLLSDMKKDLDYIYRKVRYMRKIVSMQYPVAYEQEVQPQRSSLAEEAEDDALQNRTSNGKEETCKVAATTTVEYVQMEEAVENGKPVENELIKRVCSIETTNPNDSSDCTSEDTG